MLTLETAILAIIENPADLETVGLEIMRQNLYQPMPHAIIRVAGEIGVPVKP